MILNNSLEPISRDSLFCVGTITDFVVNSRSAIFRGMTTVFEDLIWALSCTSNRYCRFWVVLFLWEISSNFELKNLLYIAKICPDINLIKIGPQVLLNIRQTFPKLLSLDSVDLNGYFCKKLNIDFFYTFKFFYAKNMWKKLKHWLRASEINEIIP